MVASGGDRKVFSNDIVNGMARVDIFDSNGNLLVKKGGRISEAHLQRMREEGAIQEEKNQKNGQLRTGVNYSAPSSIHNRLDSLCQRFSRLQHSILSEASAEHQSELVAIASSFDSLCDTRVFQVMGELYLAEPATYRFTKPLYVTALLCELVKRFNAHHQAEKINVDQYRALLFAGLLHSTGLLQIQRQLSEPGVQFDLQQKNQIRQEYPRKSLEIMQSIGITHPTAVEAVAQHNVIAEAPGLPALLLRTAFIYAGISMPENGAAVMSDCLNPSREFAKLFAEGKLDPVVGGLFLKINGLVPVGSIVQFDSREKALVIEGPNDQNISSSILRMLTNRIGVQLARPGEQFFLNKTKLANKGLCNHHQFAWSKFSPFAAWEH